MTTTQILLFAIMGLVLTLLVWGRWRYDLVAFGALIAAVIVGAVPAEHAFSGFGHPAVIIIALVLVISRGLMASGAVEMLTQVLVRGGDGIARHILVMSGVGAALSAFINNVGALALLMPIDLKVAEREKRSPSLTLMPLAFATILGGLITLIGTPPNIIIASFRAQALGAPYAMFDFAPVGLACAVAGVAFVTLFGWRLVPRSKDQSAGLASRFDVQAYIAELIVPEKSSAVGQTIAEIDQALESIDAVVLGIVRAGARRQLTARGQVIEAGDTLVVEAAPDALDAAAGQFGLEYAGQQRHEKATEGDLTLTEVVVPRDAVIEGRSALSLQLLRRHGVTLLGVSRQGRRFSERVRRLPIHAGDVLLLLGPADRLAEAIAWLGVLPLAERGLQMTRRDRAWTAIGLFGVAVGLASVGLVALPIALGAVVTAFVLLDIVPLRQLYREIEWPVIVLLGALLPIGEALESSGGSAVIADALLGASSGLPAWAVLTLVMVVTMTLSDMLNNTATAVVAGPVALEVAGRLGVSPDPFLMGVAIAASCAFLTPIGHKNNTLILGPGGYRFGDYWRMGLPLEILIIAVAVPTLLVFWPL